MCLDILQGITGIYRRLVVAGQTSDWYQLIRRLTSIVLGSEHGRPTIVIRYLAQYRGFYGIKIIYRSSCAIRFKVPHKNRTSRKYSE